MKGKLCFIQAVFFLAATGSLFAASYDDNSFQQKSRELSAMAERAYAEGDYDKAIEYAREAEENARLSEEYIRRMLARAEAETEMNRARTRMTWARGIKADVNFPDEYNAASDYVDMGANSFDEEDYEGAKRYAQLALEALSGVEEVAIEEAVAEEVAVEEVKAPIFPARYRVEKWTAAHDCFWTIAANKAVYGNPFLWPKLYEANKNRLPRRNNPNLISPGTIIEIPSLWGERREGLYNPSADYGDIREFRR